MEIKSFITKWTPRVALVFVGGYYGLGIAYEWGLMALIDKVAIQILKDSVGYAGIGAFMPTVQWYSAWAVRITIGLALGIAYDLIARSASWVCTARDSKTGSSRVGQPPLLRSASIAKPCRFSCFGAGFA